MSDTILNRSVQVLGTSLYQMLQAFFKTTWGIISALVAFESSPTAGLLMLLWFEAWTAWLVDESEKSWWPKWIEVCKERAIIVVCVLAAVIYSNTSGQEWIKEVLVVTFGGALLFFGWVRLGKRYPIVKLLQGTLARTLQGKGLSLDLQDEEGRHAHVQGMIDEAKVLDPSSKIQGLPRPTTPTHDDSFSPPPFPEQDLAPEGSGPDHSGPDDLP